MCNHISTSVTALLLRASRRFLLVFVGFVLRGGQTRTDISRSLKEMLHLPTVLPALNRNRKPGGLGEFLGIFVRVSSKVAACAQGRPELRTDRFCFFPQRIRSLAGSRQVGHEVCRLFAFLKGLCKSLSLT